MQLRRPIELKFPQVRYFVHMLRNTKWVTGQQLPIVPSAFKRQQLTMILTIACTNGALQYIAWRIIGLSAILSIIARQHISKESSEGAVFTWKRRKMEKQILGRLKINSWMWTSENCVVKNSSFKHTWSYHLSRQVRMCRWHTRACNKPKVGTSPRNDTILWRLRSHVCSRNMQLNLPNNNNNMHI